MKMNTKTLKQAWRLGMTAKEMAQGTCRMFAAIKAMTKSVDEVCGALVAVKKKLRNEKRNDPD